jgi:hypothetical protein
MVLVSCDGFSWPMGFVTLFLAKGAKGPRRQECKSKSGLIALHEYQAC